MKPRSLLQIVFITTTMLARLAAIFRLGSDRLELGTIVFAMIARNAPERASKSFRRSVVFLLWDTLLRVPFFAETNSESQQHAHCKAILHRLSGSTLPDDFFGPEIQHPRSDK